MIICFILHKPAFHGILIILYWINCFFAIFLSVEDYPCNSAATREHVAHWYRR